MAKKTACALIAAICFLSAAASAWAGETLPGIELPRVFNAEGAVQTYKLDGSYIEDASSLYAEETDIMFREIAEYDELDDLGVRRMLFVVGGDVVRDHEEFVVAMSKLESRGFERVAVDASWLLPFTDVESIVLFYCKVDDVTALKELPELKSVTLRGCQLPDPAMFFDFPFLEHFSIESSAVTYETRYKPQNAVSPITWLYFYDVSGVGALLDFGTLTNAKFMALEYCDIFGLSSLRNLTELESLIINGNSVSSLEPLSGLGKLTYLGAADNLINELGPLGPMESLEFLDIRVNGVSQAEYMKTSAELPGCNILWE